MILRDSPKHFGRPLCGLLALAAMGASAQMFDAPTSAYGQLPSGSERTADGSTSGGGRGFYITPSVGVQATLTDNVNLSATNKQSDLIVSITPSIQLGGQLGSLKGYLSYGFTASAYASGGTNISTQNSLDAQLSKEVIDNWLFVDASARISQQYIDPFGTQSSDATLTNSNRTETTTLGISPYIRGQLVGVVNYQARADYSQTNSGTSEASNSSTLLGNVHFDATTRWTRLGWLVDYLYRQDSFSLGRTTTAQIVLGQLSFAVTPEFRVSLRANSESNNIITLQTQTYNGWGWGLDWNPSPRTHLFLTEDQRFFGSSHVYGLDYRTPRSVWRISSTQSLSTGQTNTGRGNPASAYDLLFAAFATVQPDPVLRAQLVNAFLQSNGIDPNASVGSSYLPSQIQEELRQDASVALLGIRSTVIFNVYQTYSRNLGVLSNPDNDFARGNLTRWRGLGVGWSHRLTPQSTVSLNASAGRTSSESSNQESTHWDLNGIWSASVGRRATASITVRHQQFTSSAASSYNESAVIGNLSMTF
jgi:uncharacterized protein (PEP-CTERM system associated)